LPPLIFEKKDSQSRNRPFLFMIVPYNAPVRLELA
jgi:hypothetical protein